MFEESQISTEHCPISFSITEHNPTGWLNDPALLDWTMLDVLSEMFSRFARNNDPNPCNHQIKHKIFKWVFTLK